ncbi:MAG: dihydrofolate reductase, partial [Paramuribaculum sp.]|nr:dihydrofolate reductase [Paramuribaculum sp.]
MIAAVARDNSIGVKGDMPFRISADLKHFRASTIGKPVVMGRKTFQSLPHALPGRRNIIVSRSGFSAPGAETVSSPQKAVRLAAEGGAEEIMIIGGGELYRRMMPLAYKLIITEIDAVFPDADTRFPEIDADKWKATQTGEWLTDQPSGLRYRFVTFTLRALPGR